MRIRLSHDGACVETVDLAACRLIYWPANLAAHAPTRLDVYHACRHQPFAYYGDEADELWRYVQGEETWPAGRGERQCG